jgi:protein phosphatase methylesterase 1
MSDLYRSAISARLAKLPSSLPTAQTEDDDEEMVDTISDLPGSGIGPPAMQVMIFIGGVAPVFIQN